MTDVPRGTLSPGDLCVIVAHPHMDADARAFVGRTVVLIEEAPSRWVPDFLLGAPFWRTTGMPPNTLISHIILRKIPPDRMLDARSHMEPVEEKTPEKLHV
jgi:hypothetical protein